MDLLDYGPGAVTRFDFDQKDTHHVKLVCENEIVVMISIRKIRIM